MDLKQGYILVVEDDPDGSEVVQAVLRMRGITSRAAGDGEAALVMIDRDTPSLILIDLALPGMNGWGLLKAIQGRPHLAHVPCVAITAYHSLEVANAAIDAGFDAYFAKPIDTGSFVRDLENLFGG
ncbi:MAG: response regulator [Chloroflexi bacterium]|nr:response regulator [Chloroflexota bacterium]